MVRTIIRIMIHHPLPFSSDCLKNLRIRRIASLSFVSVWSTPRSKSSSILYGKKLVESHLTVADLLIVLADLLPHQPSLLCQSAECPCYGLHRSVLFLNHELERKRVTSDRKSLVQRLKRDPPAVPPVPMRPGGLQPAHVPDTGNAV
jgi:hypothetical protein